MRTEDPVRTFEDDEGARWDVVVGRESWGAFFAIFVPRERDGADAGGEVRQVMLDADDGNEAGRTLDRMDDDELRELLRESKPKKLG